MVTTLDTPVLDQLATLSRAEQEQVVRAVLLNWFDGKAGSLTLACPEAESATPQADFLIRYAGPAREPVLDNSNLSPEAIEAIRRFQTGS